MQLEGQVLAQHYLICYPASNLFVHYFEAVQAVMYYQLVLLKYKYLHVIYIFQSLPHFKGTSIMIIRFIGFEVVSKPTSSNTSWIITA